MKSTLPSVSGSPESQVPAADLQAAVDAHSIVAVTDAAGRITYANNLFCEISQYSRDELIGRDHRIINSGHHPREFFQDLWETIRAGRTWKGEIRNRAKDGSHYWVDTTITPCLGPDGAVRQYVAIRTDITQRKLDEIRLEQLAASLTERNRELETILHVASHDLRSPLVNIQGFSRELSRACLELKQFLRNSANHPVPKERWNAVISDVDESLNFIRTGVQKIESVLTGLVRLSRLGRAALQIRPVPMQSLIAEVLRSMQSQLQDSGATVQMDPIPDCLGDALQLNQVFTNLIDNAIKYRDPSRALVIRIHGNTGNGRSHFHVEDNGIGIAPEYRAKIFEIFHRLEPGRTPGEGLGLTLSQRSVDRQNGSIAVSSSHDGGSIFTLSMPGIPADASDE